jgi:hypothetical protein
MVRHPSTGQNLLMAGADLLKTPTGTAVVQQSETGLGILGAEEGKGMWVWSVVLVCSAGFKKEKRKINAHSCFAEAWVMKLSEEHKM